MATIVLLAMILPLAGVLWSADRMARARTKVPGSQSSEPLRGALEQAATRIFSAPALGDPEILVEAHDPRLRSFEIEKVAQALGGSALRVVDGETEVRLLVEIPSEKAARFAAACESSLSLESRRNGGRSILIVVVRPPA